MEVMVYQLGMLRQSRIPHMMHMTNISSGGLQPMILRASGLPLRCLRMRSSGKSKIGSL